jgi:hypothetical protein
MEPFDSQNPPDQPVEPTVPALPNRISILTGPPAPSATPPVAGQWLQDQPYGASAHAPYAVAGSSRGHRWKRLILPIIVIALLSGGAAVLFRERLFPKDGAPSHPNEWDPKVAELANFVSAERDLQWAHPVYVDFLAEADFVALFDQPTTPLSDDEQATALAYSQLYDAFGLAANYDMTQGESTVSAVTTLGFYSLSADRVYVRGDQMTPAVRVVLAHELTHALQAQHFELTAGGPGDLELRSVVEADALRVEDVYRGSLSDADKAAADTGNSLAPDEEQGLDDVPWAVVEQRYAPYVLGPMLVGDVFADEGNSGIDQLIRTPPTEEVLLNPWLYGDTSQVETSVKVEVPLGTTVLDPPQPLSQVDTLIMLDAWLPWTQARQALDGWAGSSYTSYRRETSVCFTATVTFDESGDKFADAIEAWARAAGSAAVPTTVVNDVTFEACSRGTGATAPATPVILPLQALTVEHEAIGLAGANPTADEISNYQCFAGTMIDDPLLAPLLFKTTLTTDEQALFTWQSTIAANACDVPPPA